MTDGNYEMGITRWFADYQDASTYLDMWTEESNLNYENWKNDEYNALYKKVVGELVSDEEGRIAAQIQMEKIILEDAAICPMYQPSQVYLRRTNLEFVSTPTGMTINRYTHYKE
jgi:oligopeptide transport system substrate-binding protein